ncbi:MAG: pyrroline-5-carboxylate reductase family protein, partial [Microbacteriaceae bacterium]
ISGSGPAYYFYFVEQLTRAAIARGFSPEAAERLAEGTFAGAAELLVADGSGTTELRRRVTSPGGSTERAIAVFDAAGLGDIVDRATAAALARAREMASE